MCAQCKISKSNVKFTGGEWQLRTQASKNIAWRFPSSTEQETEKLLDDKDSENTERSTNVAKELFQQKLAKVLVSAFVVITYYIIKQLLDWVLLFINMAIRLNKKN